MCVCYQGYMEWGLKVGKSGLLWLFWSILRLGERITSSKSTCPLLSASTASTRAWQSSRVMLGSCSLSLRHTIYIYIYILISWYMATCTCVFFPSCTLGMGICQMFAWHTRLNLVLFIYFTVQQQNSYKHRINLKGWNHCFNVDRKWWAQLVVVVTNNVSFLIATLKLGIAHLLRLVLLRRHR